MDYSALSDATLVRLIAEGEAQALGSLYDRYARYLYALALKMVRERATAEEIVQEVFFKFWRSPQAYQPQRGRLLVWLLSLTHHRAIDVLRSRQREQERSSPLPQDSSDGWEPVASEQPELWELTWLAVRREQVRRALASLSATQREALELAYFQGLTHQEIARRLGTPLGTVKTRIRSGLIRLRSLLGEEEVQQPDDVR